MKLSTQDFSQADYDDTVYQASVMFNDVEVSVGIFSEEPTIEPLVNEVNEIVAQLPNFDKQARQLLADDLYEDYATNEEMTIDAFKETFELVSVYFLSETEVEFTYDGGDLFDGQFLILVLADGAFDGTIAIEE